MGLFKRFQKGKPTKGELDGFKLKIKYGDDPKKHWDLQSEHYDQYRHHRDTAMDLLRKIYNVKEVNKIGHYEELRVWIYSSAGDCPDSVIGQHIYIQHYGHKNPKKGETPVCLACGKELKF